MKIVMIGTGNVATVLGRKIVQSGHHIIQVVGRDAERTQKLAASLNSPSAQRFSEVKEEADIYIIAVSDSALADIELWFPVKKEGLVVHTAGSVSKDVLRNVGFHYGILYPLQSLRSDRADIPEIPLLIDANAPGTRQQIKQFAFTLSDKVQYADDELRMKLHAGAVIVNNFTNYLYTLTQDFCTKEGIDFSLLQPLLKETVNRMEQFSPALMQTGPALRNDGATISKHLSLLQAYPVLAKLYDQLSRSIIHYYHEREQNG
ncbi:MAG TPA: F420-dependent NADP oxidoreductase [Agriterribacter sp.]|nr:F420-dependent NADP oxidoreductase [Agriterribacter sp.]